MQLTARALSELIATRRKELTDDLVCLLLRLDFGGRRMTEREVLLNCYSTHLPVMSHLTAPA